MNKEKIQEVLKNRRLISFVVALVVGILLTFTARLPVLEDYTIVEIVIVDGKETYVPLDTDVESNLLGIAGELLDIILSPNEPVVLPEVDVTPTQEVPEVTETP